jgi:hypothetical protein
VGSGTVGAQAPVDDLGLIDLEAVVVGRGQARCVADRAVDVGDRTAHPADDVVVVVPDAPLEPGRAAGRLEATDKPGRGQRVERLVHGLQGNVANPLAHAGGERLDPEVVAVAHRLKQRDADGRHPQPGRAQLVCGGQVRGLVHGANVLP